MADIARAAGVHRSTVSLALRNQARIPASTRERILGIAKSLGYAPDPMLDAFNFYRLTSQPVRGGPTIAFVSDQPTREAFHASRIHSTAYAGAKERAAALGFRTDLFLLGRERRDAVRLDRILRARGITCVIAGLLSSECARLELAWAGYCAIAIESFQLHPPLDSITSDHRAAARNQTRRFRDDGHHRIGFVTTKEEDVRLLSAPLSGYLLECARDQPPPIPPLVVEPENAAPQFRAWLRRHQPTALVAGCIHTLAAACAGTWGSTAGAIWSGSTRDSVQVALDAHLEQCRVMGARAVEFVALRQQTSQRGIPAHRTAIVLPVTT